MSRWLRVGNEGMVKGGEKGGRVKGREKRGG